MDIEHVPWPGYGVTAGRIEAARRAAFDAGVTVARVPDEAPRRAVLPWLGAPPAHLSRRLADYALHQMTPQELRDDGGRPC